MLSSGTLQIIELKDRWLLPLQGQVVVCSYAYPGLIFDLEGDNRSYGLRMNGNATFQDVEGRKQHVAEERWQEDSPELISGFEGKIIEQGFAYKDGRLELEFKDGSVLEIYPDPKYESWELAGTGDLRMIGLPGGELAIWRAEP